MKYLKNLLMSLILMGTFSGCILDDDNDTTDTQTNLTNGGSETQEPDSTTGNTQFSFDIQSVLAQSEDDEPLEITDTLDESTSFDSLL